MTGMYEFGGVVWFMISWGVMMKMKIMKIIVNKMQMQMDNLNHVKLMANTKTNISNHILKLKSLRRWCRR